MIKVITYGTFDLLHYGHIRLLQRAKALGDYLMVGLSSDQFNAVKNKKSYYTFDERKLMLESIKYVDFVFSENDWTQKIDDVVKYGADIFVMGDDWKGKFDYLSDYCQVIYLPRTPDVSTTLTKAYLTSKSITPPQCSKIGISLFSKAWAEKDHVFCLVFKSLENFINIFNFWYRKPKYAFRFFMFKGALS